MYEEKLGQDYDIYKSLNPDPFTFKKYSNNLVLNSHKMYELKFNTTDIDLKGSGNSIHFTPELLTKFRVNNNFQNIYKDSYFMC